MTDKPEITVTDQSASSRPPPVSTTEPESGKLAVNGKGPTEKVPSRGKVETTDTSGASAPTTSGPDSTTGGATTTSATGETTSAETDSKKKKGKKGKKKKKGKSRSGSRKRRKKGKKGKKKKGKKRGKKREPEETTVTESGPTYTDEDVTSYIQKREKHKTKVRELRLLHRMKQLISIVRENDLRWNKWTEEPLHKFIRDPNVDVVTVYFAKVEEKKVEKALMWASVENEATDEIGEEELKSAASKDELAHTADNSSPFGGIGLSSKVEESPESNLTIDPFKRFDKEAEEDVPIGPAPLTELHGERLIVVNKVEANNSPDLFFFVKLSPVKLNNDNFFETCAFGNVPGGHLSSLHNLLNYVYAPIFAQPDVLPDSVRNDFTANMSKLMSSMTEAHHRLQNQTMLHVPKEVLNIPVDVASRDKELCARLEDTMIHWIRQIKEVLSNQNVLDLDGGPLDELAFWETRCEDLEMLTTQIHSKAVRRVRDIMQIVKSPFVNQFNTVALEILEGSAETVSNLHYLKILREPCEKLHESKIKEIPEQLQNLLWLIRVIWLNAPFYNTRDKLNGLVRKISNELLIKCVNEIDVERIFNGYINSSEIILQDALKCLFHWRTLYMEAQKMHSMFSNKAWLLEYDKIFAHVDAFIQRLRDLLEICICQKLFARRIEGYQEDLPLYPGVKAPDITRVMKEVQKMFDNQLRRLYNYSHIILDVKNVTWHEQMASFRTAVKDMENMVQNILFSAFDNVSNIEQGVHLLKTFYNFYQRDTIIRAYDKLTVKLFKMFEDETALVKNLYSKNLLPLPLMYPQVAGRGAWALYMKQRLDLNYECLQDAWFLPECGYGNEAISQYKVLVQALVEFADKMYAEWIKQIGTKDLASRLNIPLMIRSTYRPGMIEVNFDKVLHKHIVEGEIWVRLNKEIPEVLRPVFQQREKLHNLSETVLLVVKDYNRIVAALSEEERMLFKGRIKVLDRKIYNGLTRLTWASNVSDAYIYDCRLAASKVQGFTDDYKNANIRIGKLAIKMSNRPMIRMDSKQVFPGLGFRDFQTKYREKAILKIATEYKDITLILRQIFEMFESDGNDVMIQWTKYLNVIDEIVQEAMSINIRRSLDILKRGLEGDTRGGAPAPVFKLDVVIEKDTINFSPNIPTVIDIILGIYPTICHTIRPFPRVIQFLSDPTAHVQSFSHILANDEQARLTQQHISEIVLTCTAQVEKYLKAFEPYRDIWEVNKDVFIQRYEKLQPTVTSFDSDIGRYIEVGNVIQSQESIHNVGFCILDCTKIKDSITQHCTRWQNRLCNLLFVIASNTLMEHCNYMTETVKKFTKKPDNLNDLVLMYHTFRTVTAEVPSKELSFSEMYDQFECLVKNEFEMGDEMTRKIEGYDEEWHSYLQKLKEIENMLKGVKLKMRKIYVTKADDFRKRVDKLVHEYNTEGPYLGDGITEKVLVQVNGYFQIADQLQKEEKELLSALEVFDIDISPNMNLRNFAKKLEFIILSQQ